MKQIYIDRKSQKEKLIREFDKLLKGEKAVSIISGSAGAGKTHLFYSLVPFFHNNNATVVAAKSMQHNSSSTLGIADIVNEIINKILLLPKESYQTVVDLYKKNLERELNYIQVLTPSIAKVFAINQINIKKTNDKNLIKDSIIKFIKFSTRVFFPLILYFDDLQWLDSFSLEIINEILYDKSLNLYLVLSYRENELSNNFIINKKEHKIINLKGFNVTETNKYIKKFFKNSAVDIQLSPKQVYLLTDGNPFYIKNLLEELVNKSLHNSNRINFNKSEDRFSIEELIKNKLLKLNNDELKIIKVLSLLGASVNYDLLTKILHIENLKNCIENISKLGIVYNNNNQITIIHDIVNDYIYNNISTNTKNILIVDLIRNLLNCDNYLEFNDKIISLCSQLSNFELLDINKKLLIHIYQAAQNKMHISAFDQSLVLFNLLDKMLSDIEKHQLWLNIQIDYMACLYLSGNIKKAEAKYKYLISILTDKELIRLKIVYLRLYLSSSHWEKVLEHGEEILSLYGESLYKYSIEEEFKVFSKYYKESNINNLFNNNEDFSENNHDIFYVLLTMLPAANRINEEAFKQIALKLSILGAKHYNKEYSPISYTLAVYILFHITNNYQMAIALENKTKDLLDNLATNKTIAYSLMGTFSYHINNSFSNTNKVLELAYKSGFIENENIYSNYALIFSMITEFLMGKSLLILKRRVWEVEHNNRTDNYLTKYMAYIISVIIEKFSTGKDIKLEIPKDRLAFYETVYLNYYMLKTNFLYVEGDIDEAYKVCKKIGKEVDKHLGFILNDDFYFYQTLILIEKNKSIQKSISKEELQLIKKYLALYNRYSGGNNLSHQAKSIILNIEYTSKVENKIINQNDYYTALNYAKADKNTNLMALINLIAARNHIDIPYLSKLYASYAVAFYQEWGASYIAQKIAADFEIDDKIDQQTISLEQKNNNLSDYLKKLNKASEQEVAYMFINSLFEVTEINRVCILFEEENEYYINYDAFKNEKIKDEILSINHCSNINQGIIRYVFRTQQSVENNNNEISVFNELDYNKYNNFSIYAIPLFINNIMIACCYIEYKEKIDYEKIKSLISLFSNSILSKRIGAKKEHSKAQSKIKLTKREIEISKLITEGYSNKEISKQTFISEGTCRNHISNIYNKLNVKNRIQAVNKLKEINL